MGKRKSNVKTSDKEIKLHRCSLKYLQQLARQRRIRNYSRYNKFQLIRELQNEAQRSAHSGICSSSRSLGATPSKLEAARKIWYWFRGRKLLRDAVDPITLEPPEIPFLLIYEYRVFVFDAVTLASYIKSSKNFENPLNRRELNIVETRRLERASKIPLLELFRNRVAERARVLEIENELAVRKMLISEKIDGAIRHAQRIQNEDDNDPRVVEGYLAYFTFLFLPGILSDCANLDHFCRRHATDSIPIIQSLRCQIEGPPNRPVEYTMHPRIYNYLLHSFHGIEDILRNNNSE
jgi:hypothetical protein